ncbi:MAG TPA: hypothetical protein DD670_14390 [Planctomycetaceae bacterium]|nr:hypothetical protein [Planctomycetaceae bacterium]
MWSRLRWTDWCAVAAILLILNLLLFQKYADWKSHRQYELRIAAFDQDEFAPWILPAERLVADETLTGRWKRVRRKYDGSTLVFERSSEANGEKYRVEFATHTCTAQHKATRTAEYSGGQVSLDRPVADAIGPVYQRLHCVRVADTKVLIPEIASQDVAALLTAIEEAESRGEWDSLRSLIYVYFRDEGRE